MSAPFVQPPAADLRTTARTDANGQAAAGGHVVPEKRKLMVVGGAIAAAFMLPGCAPAGYNAADYNGGAPAQEPAANAVDATPSAEAQAEDTAEKAAAPELSDDEVTSELVAKSIPRMGQTVVDQNGFVLY